MTTYAISYVDTHRPSYIEKIQMWADAIRINGGPDARAVILTNRQTDLPPNLEPLAVRFSVNGIGGLPLMLELVTLQHQFALRHRWTDHLVMMGPDVLLQSSVDGLFLRPFEFATLWREHSRDNVMNIWFAPGTPGGRRATDRILSRCLRLLSGWRPELQEWYGDQRSLQAAFGPYGQLTERPEGSFVYRSNRLEFLDCGEIAPNPRRERVSKKFPTPMIHFKGDRKEVMREYFNLYIEPKRRRE